MAEKNEKGKIVIISGFSGVGKGTIIQKMTKLFDDYSLSVSWTTRKPRNNEIHGVNYYFVTKEKFRDAIGRNGFLEFADYNGKYYGTPRAFVEEQLNAGKNVILEIEIQGALQIKEQYPEAVLLFIMPPSAMELKKRLTGRGTETEEVIAQRLKRAKEESVGIEKYDYIVVNDDLDECVEQVHDIISAAHMSPSRNLDFINTIRNELNEL